MTAMLIMWHVWGFYATSHLSVLSIKYREHIRSVFWEYRTFATGCKNDGLSLQSSSSSPIIGDIGELSTTIESELFRLHARRDYHWKSTQSIIVMAMAVIQYTMLGSIIWVISVASTKIFEISVLVSDHDCDKQPSCEYCEEGTKWF